MELRWLSAGDEEELVAASGLFDGAVRPEWARAFLGRPDHHLAIASEGGLAAGFVSGVELTHPDKGTEMFLYELGVDDAFRGRGIGRALVEALAELARSRGCYDLWVLTDEDNPAALATYRSAGARRASTHVMLSWDLDGA